MFIYYLACLLIVAWKHQFEVKVTNTLFSKGKPYIFLDQTKPSVYRN